jgi:TonB family protein
MPTARSQAFSLGLHVLLALFLLAISLPTSRTSQARQPLHVTPLTFSRPRNAPEPRGGGSNHTALPARHGAPPPRAYRTFIPPTTSDHPPIALPITIAIDVPLVSPSATIGDPYSFLAKGAFGNNGDNRIGNHGCCQGIGESSSGPPGLSVHRGAGGTPPQLIYKVEPEFSEEARKAKQQGVVVLTIEVDASGQVRNVRVRQSLGLGLDEKAIDAVSHWRFRPAILDGKPVTAEAVVQVNFQLL